VPSVPFWVAARLPVFESNLYAPQVLTQDGSRLYFEAVDPLVARDTNTHIDVYQWEQLGAGGAEGCRETDQSFAPGSGGCISLISSGQSNRDAEFVDASASGEDVFFTTLASLVPQDYGLLDIYDARVGGGFPAPPTPQPECEAENCQHPPPAPQFQTPSSNTYTGPGNLPPEGKPKKCPKGTHKAKKNKKSVCMKNRKPKRARQKPGGEPHPRSAR
jgi:hypothetical protein